MYSSDAEHDASNGKDFKNKHLFINVYSLHPIDRLNGAANMRNRERAYFVA